MPKDQGFRWMMCSCWMVLLLLAFVSNVGARVGKIIGNCTDVEQKNFYADPDDYYQLAYGYHCYVGTEKSPAWQTLEVKACQDASHKVIGDCEKYCAEYAIQDDYEWTVACKPFMSVGGTDKESYCQQYFSDTFPVIKVSCERDAHCHCENPPSYFP